MDKRLQWADAITLERIGLLHPAIRSEVRELYLQINTMLPKGVRLRFSQTLRSSEYQRSLYNQGRTTPGKIVTYAMPGQSIHEYGLAFDIVLLYDKDGNGTLETADWVENSHWKKVVSFFKSNGWSWGGDWTGKKRDSPHFEKTFGNTWRELSKKNKSLDNNGNEYVIL
jgi:peptidoglycan L-alanyl-D-glutamate endopeptidase CwlK